MWLAARAERPAAHETIMHGRRHSRKSCRATHDAGEAPGALGDAAAQDPARQQHQNDVRVHRAAQDAEQHVPAAGQRVWRPVAQTLAWQSASSAACNQRGWGAKPPPLPPFQRLRVPGASKIALCPREDAVTRLHVSSLGMLLHRCVMDPRARSAVSAEDAAAHSSSDADVRQLLPTTTEAPGRRRRTSRSWGCAAGCGRASRFPTRHSTRHKSEGIISQGGGGGGGGRTG